MIKLENISPDRPESSSKKAMKKENSQLLQEIYTLQRKLYAESKQSLLIVLQGMDASGKDGLTRNLFQLASPSWTEVSSFKKPTDLEFSHDFLWRIHKEVPANGMIGVFNRSHYEDILVPSVYGYIDDKKLKYICDANPYKINRFTPGSNIKIISKHKMRTLKPKFLLVLIWSFRKEVIQREKNFLNKGGKLIFHLPMLHIVDKSNYKCLL